MARIPTFQQNQRLQAPGVALEDPSFAARPGRDIASLGENINQFTVQLAKFNAIKNQADEALFKSSIKNEADAMYVRIRDSLRTDPTMARDGSDIEDRYKAGFSELLQNAEDIEDGRKRMLAKNTIMSVMHSESNLKDIYALKEARALSYLQNEYETTVRQGAINIMQNPALFVETQQSLKNSEVLDLLPVDQRLKAERWVEKETSLALIKSYTEAGNFSVARELINSSVGATFDEEGRQKLLDRINKQEEMELKLASQRDVQEQKKLKAEFEEQRTKIKESIHGRFLMAESYEERQVLIKEAQDNQARGLIDAGFVKSLQRDDVQILKEVSDATQFDFTVRLAEKKDLKTFLRDLESARGRTLTHNDARELYNQYMKAAKGSGAKSKTHAKEQKLASDLAQKTIFGKELINIPNRDRDQEKLATYTAIQMKAWEIEGKGKKPMDAMKEAMKQFGYEINMPKASIKGVPPDVQQDPKRLNQHMKKVFMEMQKKKAAGKLKPAEEKRMLQILKEAKDRLDSWEKVQPGKTQ